MTFPIQLAINYELKVCRFQGWVDTPRESEPTGLHMFQFSSQLLPSEWAVTREFGAFLFCNRLLMIRWFCYCIASSNAFSILTSCQIA